MKRLKLKIPQKLWNNNNDAQLSEKAKETLSNKF